MIAAASGRCSVRIARSISGNPVAAGSVVAATGRAASSAAPQPPPDPVPNRPHGPARHAAAAAPKGVISYPEKAAATTTSARRWASKLSDLRAVLTRLPRPKPVTASLDVVERGGARNPDVATNVPRSCSSPHHAHLNDVLQSLFEVCEVTKDSKTAIKFFQTVRSAADKAKVSLEYAVSIETYHSLLGCAAKASDLASFQKAWTFLETDGLQPDAKCFAMAFMCAGNVSSLKAGGGGSDPGRSSSSSAGSENRQRAVVAFLQSLVGDAKRLSMPGPDQILSNVVDRCEREAVLWGLRQVFPGCDDGDHPIDVGHESTANFIPYDNPLLSELDQRDASCLASPLAGLYGQGPGLDAKFRQQLGTERALQVDVHSIVSTASGDGDKNEEAIDNVVEEWRAKLTAAVRERLRRLERRHHGAAAGGQYSSDRTLPVHKYLAAVGAEGCAQVAVNEVQRLLCSSESFSPSVTVLQKQLGQGVMKMFRLRRKEAEFGRNDFAKRIASDYYGWLADPATTTAPDRSNSSICCHREAVEEVMARTGWWPPSPAEWPFSVLIAVGRELLHLMMNEVRVATDDLGQVVTSSSAAVGMKTKTAASSTFPALYRIYRTRKDLREVEEVKPHPALAKLFGRQKQRRRIRFAAEDLPMVAPPLPWTGPRSGGYLLLHSDLVRVSSEALSSAAWHGFRKAGGLGRDLSLLPVLDSLNQLGTTPWKVNEPLLDLVADLFVRQERYPDRLLATLGVPKDPDRLPALALPASLKRSDESEVGGGGPGHHHRWKVKEYQEFVAKRQAHQQLKAECYSLWCDMLYRLSIANHFRHDVLYFPHNIDFRGRVYPLPPHFNHMGGDLVRSLLVFAQGKPLGPGGLNWLKLHAVNLTGLKKRDPVGDRLAYADSILDDILDSAEDPLGGITRDGSGGDGDGDGDGDDNLGDLGKRKWWLGSDEPLQTLATCIEIRNALRCPQGPENYVCHLPIHQDGSCNGLQHYAALGRDVLGARSVNVLPADRPQDVYNEIATIVERKRAEDEVKGEEIAKLLKGFVKRKVIKQTVMTTVYGVTKYGAKLQIARQLEDNPAFPVEHVESASKYLADKTFESLNEMFEASQEIQAWFTECAQVISKSLRQLVRWETPLGLKVVQPYVKKAPWPPFANRGPTVGDCVGEQGDQEASSVRGHKHDFVLQLLTPPSRKNKIRQGRGDLGAAAEWPNVLKQKNGFPPNFVHSLDSTHMMLTSLHLWRSGLTFASVHDCYWTHACTVDPMNRVCRRQFFNMHSQPILENLSDLFIETYLAEDPRGPRGGGNSSIGFRPDLVELAKARALFASIPLKGDLNLAEVMESTYFFS